MAFTTPGTAVAGDVLTAAFYNANVRDNIADLRAVMANVKSATKTDTFSEAVASTASSALVTGLTATITPTLATSKVLVHGFISVGLSISTDQRVFFRIERNQPSASTLVGVGDTASNRRRMTGSGVITNLADMPCLPFCILDSPATTSEIIYSITLAHTSGLTRTIFVNRSGTDSDDAFTSRGASSIVVQEIPA